MLQEEKVTWKNGNEIGEGMWASSRNDRGVVICHPHPQMGGSMYNNVVEAIRDAFISQGYSTLRFNFRGVGGSTGRYDEGRGEKQDILSACEYLKGRGIKKIALAGYSFGAWVACNLLKENPSMFEKAILVSPPDKFVVFDWNGLEDAVDLIVCGKLDPFCDVNNLKLHAEKIHAMFRVMPSVDHFYDGYETQLTDYLNQHLNEKK